MSVAFSTMPSPGNASAACSSGIPTVLIEAASTMGKLALRDGALLRVGMRPHGWCGDGSIPSAQGDQFSAKDHRAFLHIAKRTMEMHNNADLVGFFLGILVKQLKLGVLSAENS